MRRHMAKVRHLEVEVTEGAVDRLQFLMRQLQKVLQDAELVKDFERRGMNGVTTEIAKEVLVFLDYRDPYTPARQKVSEHDSGGAAADYAARRRKCLGCHGLSGSASEDIPAPVYRGMWL